MPNAFMKDVFIIYCSFTNMFRLLTLSSLGLLSRMLEIQTNMLKCISEPHNFFFFISKILVIHLDDDRDSNRNILRKEQ